VFPSFNQKPPLGPALRVPLLHSAPCHPLMVSLSSIPAWLTILAVLASRLNEDLLSAQPTQVLQQDITHFVGRTLLLPTISSKQGCLSYLSPCVIRFFFFSFFFPPTATLRPPRRCWLSFSRARWNCSLEPPFLRAGPPPPRSRLMPPSCILPLDRAYFSLLTNSFWGTDPCFYVLRLGL